MYKIHPTGYRVLLAIYPPKETITEGGLVIDTNFIKDADGHLRIADGATKQKAHQEATVLEIGKDAFKAYGDGEPWCKVGDRVMITKYCGEDRIDYKTGILYRIINDDDIIAVIGEDQ
jgi:co-chaperonin GroES (HSP10)